jgi:hypothetical protein
MTLPKEVRYALFLQKGDKVQSASGTEKSLCTLAGLRAKTQSLAG